jgi:hypothetical protein
MLLDIEATFVEAREESNWQDHEYLNTALKRKAIRGTFNSDVFHFTGILR